MTGNSRCDDPDFVVAGPGSVQPSLKVARPRDTCLWRCSKKQIWRCLTDCLAEHEIDRMRGNLAELRLITKSPFKDG